MNLVRNSAGGALFFGMVVAIISFLCMMFFNTGHDVVNNAFLSAVTTALIQGAWMTLVLFVIGLFWGEQHFGVQGFTLAVLYLHGSQSMGVNAFVLPFKLVYILTVTLWPLMLTSFVGIPLLIFIYNRLYAKKTGGLNTPHGPDH